MLFSSKKLLVICVLMLSIFSLLMINRIGNICYLNYDLNEDVKYIKIRGKGVGEIFQGRDEVIISDKQKICEVFNALNRIMLLKENSKIAYVNYFPTTDELDLPWFYRVIDFITNERLKFIDFKRDILIIQCSENGTEIGEVEIINDYYISTEPAGWLFKKVNKSDSFVRTLKNILAKEKQQ